MSRKPRNTDPTYARHVSIRTENAQLMLVPSARVNQMIGGIIAKYQEEFSITIYAYTVLSNHIHIIARATKRNLWRFEQGVNREVAKRMNRLLGRSGHFWGRRYDEQMIAEEGDSLEALLYVTCNAVSHGLERHPSLWPGLNSYAQMLDEKDRIYTFTDYTALGKALRKARRTKKRVNPRDFETRHVLRLTPIPELQHLSQEERRTVLLRLVTKRVRRIKDERRAQGQGFLGRENVLRQPHTAIPRSVKRTPRPICYTKSFEAKKRFMSWYFPWLEAFREASRRFRSGELLVEFPENSIKPPIHYSLLQA